MVKTSNEKKELEKETQQLKEKVMDTYNIRLYDDDECKRLYNSELGNINTFISAKINKKLSALNNDVDEDDEAITIDENKIKKSLMKSLSTEDYEKIFPKTTSYIKNNIFHGYDSMYYVLNKNSHGHILPLEYNNANFTSTFGKYFETHIANWFNKYSRKIVLTISNTEDRVFKKNNTNYLNLFSGYRFNRRDKRDLERIQRGSKGVKFIWNHIYEIWNSSVDLNFKYDQKWIRKLMFGNKLKTMIYLKGKMGRGKTAIVKFIMKCMGMHNCLTLSNDAVFMSDFNGPLVGVTLCLLDEIVHDFNIFKSLYNKLKPYITDDDMAYRNLYEKLKNLLNLTSFIMSGNYDMLKLDDPTKGDDRRIKPNDVTEKLQSAEYFMKLDSYIDNEDVQYAFSGIVLIMVIKTLMN
jgi:hypothetical protein